LIYEFLVKTLREHIFSSEKIEQRGFLTPSNHLLDSKFKILMSAHFIG